MRYLLLFFILGWTLTASCKKEPEVHNDPYPPEGFVYTREALPGALHEIRYFSDNNFMGRPADGYLAPEAVLTSEAARAMRKVQLDLNAQGYEIKIFDCYRPQKAVDHFMRWAMDPEDTLKKSEYYPGFDKPDLFRLGYLIEKSGHTRGSTIDLTIVHRDTEQELDMGSPYDFFGPVSNHGTTLITARQEANRNILRDAMLRHGFKILPEEWWHFTLADEPYPDTYFRFEVR